MSMSIDTETARLYAYMITHDQQRPFGSLIACLGSKMILRTETGIRFDIHNAAHRVTLCALDYDAGLDLFNLTFYRAGKIVKKFSGLYNDQIKEIFEEYTGLVTNFRSILGIGA